MAAECDLSVLKQKEENPFLSHHVKGYWEPSWAVTKGYLHTCPSVQVSELTLLVL